MEITEVRVKLVNVKNDKLRAFCSITVDNDFVIRDLKVIEGAKGAFVAMPSRKLTERCSRCNGKNHYRARYCNDCGARLPGGARHESSSPSSSQKLHTDIAHPINSRCREVIQKRVLEVYQQEISKSVEPGYRPMELEVFDEDSLTEETVHEIGAVRDARSGGDVRSDAPVDSPQVAAPVMPAAQQGMDRGGEALQGGAPAAPSAAGREQGGREQGGREQGGRFQERPFERRQDGNRDAGDSGRGNFRRGFRGPERDSREGDRREGRRPNGGGRGDGRREPPGEGERMRERPVRERVVEPGSLPEKDRQQLLPSEAASDARPPHRDRLRKEPDPEPEDNFGAGLFN